MKKTFIYLSIVFILAIILTGCVHSFYFEYDELVQDMEKAEIINLDKNYTIDTDIEIISTLTYDETLQLLSELSRIEYKDTPIGPGVPPSPMGHCIRVWYSDGHCDIYGYSGTSVAWGECDKETFNALIEKYISN